MFRCPLFKGPLIINFYVQAHTSFGSSGMWCLRMLALTIIVYLPSNTEGVGTSHLNLIWVMGLKLLVSNPTS